MTRTRRNAALTLFGVSYSIYFFRLTRTGLHSWFSEDDLLNIFYVFAHPVWQATRPVGGLWLYVLYSLFGFHPGPFNVARLILCFANLFLLYAFSSRLAGSREIGVLTVMIAGFNPALRSIYYDSGMIFDALAFFFFYAAFTLYLYNRRAVWVLLLYVAALGSKEIAVSFPVAILLWELTGSRRLRLPLIAGAITLLYIVVKNTGPHALSAQEGYRLHFSLGTYLDAYAHYMGEFTGLTVRPYIAYVLAGCVAVAFALRDRVLTWASLFNLVSILPVAFIPVRNGFAALVPFAGWGIYLAALIRAAVPFPARIAVAAAWVLLVLRPQAQFTGKVLAPVIHKDQYLNRDAWNSLRAVLPADLSHQKVLALHDPFTLPYALYFMICLGYHDAGLTVDHAPGEERYDIVLDYADGKFIRVTQSRNVANLPGMADIREASFASQLRRPQ